jgi:hypothetical protein
MATKFLLRVIKDVYVDLKSDDEANQVAELLASRESHDSFLGNMTSVYTEVHRYN